MNWKETTTTYAPKPTTLLTFKQNHPITEVVTELEGENIQHYVDAFRKFLLAIEFAPDTIERALGERGDE